MPTVHIPRKMYDKIRDLDKDFNEFVKEAVRQKIQEEKEK